MKIRGGVGIAGFILLAGCLTLNGCGYKNRPVPPDTVVPEPVNDLRYSIDETGITLTWSFPVKSIAGGDVEVIDSFDLYRAVVPLEEYCPSCPIPFGEPIEISGGTTSTDSGSVKQATYKSTLLRSGNRYFFKVRSSRSWWAESSDSNIVSFVWHVPAKAPAELLTEAKDNLVSLTWQPVSTLVNDEKITGMDIKYQVMRSDSGQQFINVGQPVAATSFTDRQVINGKKYFYKVQSIMYIDGNEVKGGVSSAAAARPVDMTPPQVVSGVKAIRSGRDIKIIWNASDKKDVKGYRVYRRLANQDTPVKIGEMKSIYTIFVDKNAPKNIRVYYSVTAIDDAEKPNESVFSREATLRD